jgi:WD40 repeat protein
LRSDLALAQASGVNGTRAGTVLTGIVGAEAVSWDTVTGASLSRVAVKDGDVTAVAANPHGSSLAVAWSSQVDGQSRDLVALFDTGSGKPVRELPPLDSKVRDLTFSPDGTLIGARYGVKFTVWEADTGAEKWAFDKNAAAIFSADGSKLAVADTDGALNVWSLASGQQVMATTIEQKFGVTLAFDATVQRLAASTDPLVGNSYQGGVLVWDISNSGEPMHTLSGTGGHVYSLEFSTDGALLASGHNNGNVAIWKMEDGSQTATLEGHTGAVVALAMTKSAGRLATASLDGTFKLWDTSTGREVMTLHDTALADAGAAQPARLLFTKDDQRLLAITQPQALQPIILRKN